MTVRETSAKTYYDLEKEGRLAKQSGRVYDWVLKQNRMVTRSEISAHTGISINAVAGRVNELVSRGFLLETGKIKCPISNRTVYGLQAKTTEKAS